VLVLALRQLSAKSRRIRMKGSDVKGAAVAAAAAAVAAGATGSA
jgi:hypothetical protein